MREQVVVLRITTDKLFDLAGARSRYAKSIRLHCNGSSNALLS